MIFLLEKSIFINSMKIKYLHADGINHRHFHFKILRKAIEKLIRERCPIKTRKKQTLLL